jgi:hypothetical protein
MVRDPGREVLACAAWLEGYMGRCETQPDFIPTKSAYATRLAPWSLKNMWGWSLFDVTRVYD